MRGNEPDQDGRSAGGPHISEEQFARWREGVMGQREEMDFFSHVSCCTFCAGRFGEWMQPFLVEPPPYLADEILERAAREEAPAAGKPKGRSRRSRLFWYSVEVGLAVAAAVLALFLTPGLSGKGQLEAMRQQGEAGFEAGILDQAGAWEASGLEKGKELAGMLQCGSEKIRDALRRDAALILWGSEGRPGETDGTGRNGTERTEGNMREEEGTGWEK